MAVFYQCVAIISGVILLTMNLIHIAKKKMDVGIGTSWTIMSALIIAFGIAFDFTKIEDISPLNVILMIIFLGALVVALYLYGLRITEVKKKVNDIAIWVSIIRKDTYKFKGNDNKASASDESTEKEDGAAESK